MNVLLRNFVVSTFISGAALSAVVASDYDPNNPDLVGMSIAMNGDASADALYRRYINVGKTPDEQNARNRILVRVATMRNVEGGSREDWGRLAPPLMTLEGIVYKLSHLVKATQIADLMGMAYGALVDALLPMRNDSMALNVDDEVRRLAAGSANRYARRIADWAVANFVEDDMREAYDRMVVYTPDDLNEDAFVAALDMLPEVYRITREDDMSAEGDTIVQKVFGDFIACRRLIDEINRLPAGAAAALNLVNFRQQFANAMQAMVGAEGTIPLCALRLERKAKLLYWHDCYDGPNPISIRALDWLEGAANLRLLSAARIIDGKNMNGLDLPGGMADQNHVSRILNRANGLQAGLRIGFNVRKFFQSPYDLLTDDADLERYRCTWDELSRYMRDWVRAANVREVPQEVLRESRREGDAAFLYVLLDDYGRGELHEARYEKVRWGLRRIIQFLREQHGDATALLTYVNATMHRCNDGIRNYVQSAYTDEEFAGMIPIPQGAPLHRKMSELKKKLVTDLIAGHTVRDAGHEYQTATPLFLAAKLASMLDRNPQEMLYPGFARFEYNDVPQVMKNLLQGWRIGNLNGPCMLSVLDLIRHLNAREKIQNEMRALAVEFIINDPRAHIREFDALLITFDSILVDADGPTNLGWIYVLERLGIVDIAGQRMEELMRTQTIEGIALDALLRIEDRAVKETQLRADDFYR